MTNIPPPGGNVSNLKKEIPPLSLAARQSNLQAKFTLPLPQQKEKQDPVSSFVKSVPLNNNALESPTSPNVNKYSSDSESSKSSRVKNFVKSFNSNVNKSKELTSSSSKIENIIINPLFKSRFPQNQVFQALVSPREEKKLEESFFHAEEEEEIIQDEEEKKAKDVSPTRRTSSPAIFNVSSLENKSLSSTSNLYPKIMPRDNSNYNIVERNLLISPRLEIDRLQEMNNARIAELGAKQANFEEFIKNAMNSKNSIPLSKRILAKTRELDEPIAVGEALVSLLNSAFNKKEQKDQKEKQLNEKQVLEVVRYLWKDRETIPCVFQFLSKSNFREYLCEQKWFIKNPEKYIDHLLAYFVKHQMDIQLFRSDNVVVPFISSYLENELEKLLKCCYKYVEENKSKRISTIIEEFYARIYSENFYDENYIKIRYVFNSIKTLVKGRCKNDPIFKEFMPKNWALAAVTEMLFLRILNPKISSSKGLDQERVIFCKILTNIEREFRNRLLGQEEKTFSSEDEFYNVAENLFYAHKKFIETISHI